MLELDGARVFAEVLGPPPRLLVVGAIDTAEELCRAAKALGWRTAVIDPRPALVTRERLPSPDELTGRLAGRAWHGRTRTPRSSCSPTRSGSTSLR